MSEVNSEVNLATTARRPGTEAFALSAFTQVGIYEFPPVVFRGAAGGAGEYHGSNNPNAPENHIIDVPIPAGTRILEAWYSPFHNIAALSAFAWIDVNKHNDTQVLLSVAGYVGSNNRLRIKIHVLYAG
jgi:hypothetical protein